MLKRTLTRLEFDQVLGHLASFAVSEAGKRACLAISPPQGAELSVNKIEKQGLLFEETCLWQSERRFKLTDFPDLTGVFSFLSRSAELLDLDALWAVRTVLLLKKLIEESLLPLKKTTSSEPKALLAEAAAISNWPYLLEFCLKRPEAFSSLSALERCLTDDGRLNDDSSPELASIRSQVRSIHQQCTRKVKEFAKNYAITHYLQEDFMTLSSDRYVLPFKSNFKGQMEGIIHDYSQTGETCYFEPFFLVELNNKLQELKQEEREEERKILRYLTGLLRSEEEGLNSSYNFLVSLDVLLAKCELSAKYNGRLIRFYTNEEGADINLPEARHPLLALFMPDKVVPVSIELSNAQRALIISGGNAGGKTVTLKSVGLLALMGLCSIPAPVGQGSRLPLWRHVFAFIGDEQSLAEHVSTYTAQIEHLAEIWPQVGADSLVILDEFGAGTDPAQGSALAQAVVDEILNQHGYVIAATHFPAFKTYALSRPNVRAASVLFDEISKKPLYTLAYDQVGASLALDVAKAHGLPTSIIQQAEKYLLMEDSETAVLIERLNSLAVQRQGEIAAMSAAKEKFDEKRAKLVASFEKQRAKLLAEIDHTRRELLAEVRSERLGRKQALKEMSGLKHKLASSNVEIEGEAALAAGQNQAGSQAGNCAKEPLACLKAGAMAVYTPWGRQGRVEEVDERKERAKLDFDGLSIWASFGDLQAQPSTGAKAQAQAAVTPPSGNKKISAVTAPKAAAAVSSAAFLTAAERKVDSLFMARIDLRGLRADEALPELERALDQARLGGRDGLEVVHGRGTGALRREVHAFLHGQPGVARFFTANEDQGGDGLTIVELE